MSSSRRSPRDFYAEQVATAMGPRVARPRRSNTFVTTVILCIIGLLSVTSTTLALVVK